MMQTKILRKGIAIEIVILMLISTISIIAFATGSESLTEATIPTASNTQGTYKYIKDLDSDGYCEVGGIPNVNDSDIKYLREADCKASYIVPSSGTTIPRTPKWNRPWDNNYFVYAGGGVKEVKASNCTDTDKTYREINGVKYYVMKNGIVDPDMVLGKSAVKFSNGFSVLPSDVSSAEQCYVLFDVKGTEYNRFYAVAGMTGSAFNTSASNVNKDNKVIYEVWGSENTTTDASDSSFVRLAYTNNINNYVTAEFDVDITNVKTIKLVTKIGAGNTSGTNSLWGNPCVYKVNAPASNNQTVTASVIWDHGTNPAGNQPTSTTVLLYANNDASSGRFAVLNAENNWSHTWDNLSSSDTYTVKQSVIPSGYNEEITGTTIKNTFINNGPAQDAYTESTDGSYKGATNVKDGNLTYLSDLSYKESFNSTKSNNTYKDTPYGETGKITIGTKNNSFDKGLGVHPKAPNVYPAAYTSYDLSGLNADRFYAAVGITNVKGQSGMANAQVTYKVYGDYGDGLYKLLAESKVISLKSSGEFVVDINNVKILKLEIICSGSSNASCGSAWANASVYKYSNEGTTVDNNGSSTDEKLQPNAYLGSTSGNYVGVTNAESGKVTYLSDLAYIKAYNASKSDNTTKDTPYAETGKITIGSKNTIFAKGLGVHPMAPGKEAYTTYDVSQLNVDRFYSAVGITNANGKSGNADAQVSFHIYGDYGDGNYTLLAKSETLKTNATGELNVDITSVKILKLVILCDGESNTSCGSTWAGACIYKYSANGKSITSVTGTDSNQSSSQTVDATPTDGYTPFNTKYNGVPTDYFKSIKYLSDYKYLEASNTTNKDYPEGQPTTINSPYNNTGSFVIGENDTVFFMGLGVHPKNPKAPINGTTESWTIFDVSELNCNRFYSAVGMASDKGKTVAKGSVFRVYADYGDGQYKLIAQSDTIIQKHTGEFDIDISGVKKLRLAVICAGNAYDSCSSAWANPCVYSTAEASPMILPSKSTTELNNSTSSINENSNVFKIIIVAISLVILVGIFVTVFVILRKRKTQKKL